MNPFSESVHLDTDRIRMHILQRFFTAGQAPVSGGELAGELAMSRTAVWKHIKALEDIGFGFEAAPRRGYRLTQIPNLVMEPLLRQYLNPERALGRTVFWYPSVSSTNAVANQLAKSKEVPHGTVITAVEQDGGRGRQGKTWNSPAGGLWMSVVLKRAFPLVRAAELTLMASVAIARAVEDVAGVELDIKWPNDLLYGGKKVCGILAELRAGGENVEYAVLGIGLNTNVTSAQIPEELQPIATSLLIVTDKETVQAQLAAAILNEFETLYDSLLTHGKGFALVADEWQKRCVTLGNHVKIRTPQGVIEGVAHRVDGGGVLYLMNESGDETAIHSGDVLF